MQDDWRDRLRRGLHRDSFVHPNSPAGRHGTAFSQPRKFTDYSWPPLPDPESPAGRLIHWPTELWRIEQRERDEIAHHVEELERSLAARSDDFRLSIPDSYLRTLYDRQVGRVKGTYGFAKSLVGTGIDAAIFLQKLTSPLGWFDPDLRSKLRQACALGLGAGGAYFAWEFGTLQEKKELLTQAGKLAQRVYDDAQQNIQQQWSEAKRTGKQEELIEKWKTRMLLEIGILFVGAGELKAAGSAVEGLEMTFDANRTVEVSEEVVRVPSKRAAMSSQHAAIVAETLKTAETAVGIEPADRAVLDLLRSEHPSEPFIDLGSLDHLGRPTGVRATITQEMLLGGTEADSGIVPTGWSGDGKMFNEARGHLLGAQFGGPGDLPENLVTMKHAGDTLSEGTNLLMLKVVERPMRAAVESGETVYYYAKPIFDGASPGAKGVTVVAEGTDGFFAYVTLLNPIKVLAK